MVASGYRLIILLSSTGGSALPGTPLRLSVSYQDFVEHRWKLPGNYRDFIVVMVEVND